MEKQRKKILFITTISGFLPQFEKNDVKILQESGYEIHYASNFDNPVYEFDREELTRQGIVMHHINIEKNPGRIGPNLRAFWQLRKIIDQEQIKLIHCHNPMGGVVGRFAAVCSKEKPYVIYTAHGFHFYKGAPAVNWLLYYTAERLLSHCTNQLVTINWEDYCRARSFPFRKGGSAAQIHGVGVDRNRFCPRPELRSSKRKSLHVPEHAFHIVTAAQLNDNKNQKVVIEAIAALGKKDIYYSICGEGPNEGMLRRLIEEKGLTKQVRILGYRTDMEEILSTADCFAFPSYREGLGIAAVEALNCGVPLLAADNRGTREYAVDGYNSIVCKAEDTEGFRKAIMRLYKDHGFRSYLAGNCRESVEAFGIERVEATMRRVYRVADRAVYPG
jgi:glycosyltransferase involved in cell wall biosynthesis